MNMHSPPNSLRPPSAMKSPPSVSSSIRPATAAIVGEESPSTTLRSKSSPSSSSSSSSSPSFLLTISQIILVLFGIQVISKFFTGTITPTSRTSSVSTINPSANIIKPSTANRLNRERFEDRKRPSTLKKVLGIKEFTTSGNYIAPLFPTHDEDGNPLPSMHQCVISSSSILDLYVYLTPFKAFEFRRDKRQLVWNVSDIPFNWNYKHIPSMDLNITMTRSLRNNGSLYAHVFFAKQNATLDKADVQYDPLAVVYRRVSLVIFRPKIKEHIKRKLLTDDDDDDDDDHNDGKDNNNNSTDVDGSEHAFVGHWCPTLSLSLVLDMPPFARNQIPPVMSKAMDFTPDGSYYPVIYHNNFWIQSKQMIEMNASLTQLPLSLSYASIASWKWALQNSMEEQWEVQQKTGLGTERDADLMRETLLETSPWLLGVTFVVSLLHMLFDFLAFKNDIQFWRTKKSMEGMSVQTLAVNSFFQTVIFFYLFDNEASTLILISTGIGLLIEYWKLQKAFNITIEWNTSFQIKWHISDTYVSYTQEHDSIATVHLLYVMTPAVTGYSIYSLLHNAHKSFYSWALGSLVGFVYAFGFMMMTPQLYINYRLKSVAHMPWKAMVYKALNTFIDDLFAFIIKMPTLHRLSCFRDDLIFFVYLYQRWIYRIDYSRVNEFGQSGDDDDQPRIDLTTKSTDSLEEEDSRKLSLLLDKLDRFARTRDPNLPSTPLITTTPSSSTIKKPNTKANWQKLRAAAMFVGKNNVQAMREKKFEEDLEGLLVKLEKRLIQSKGTKKRK